MALTTRAVTEPRIHHRRRFVNPAADLGHDLVDDSKAGARHRGSNVGQVEQASALNIDLFVRVNEDIRDSWILKKSSSGPRPKTSSNTSSQICCFSIELRRVCSSLISASSACRTSVRTRWLSIVARASRLILSSSFLCSVNFSSWYSDEELISDARRSSAAVAPN